MKKMITILIGMIFMMVTVVSATETTLAPSSVTMTQYDSTTVEFCFFEGEEPVDVDVDVSPICEDINGMVGCSAGDVFSPAGFSVVPQEPTTGEDGCVLLDITTSVYSSAKFYYTVNGQISSVNVGGETGSAVVYVASQPDDDEDKEYERIRPFMRNDEIVRAGEVLEMLLSVKNTGTVDVEDLVYSITVPELGLFFRDGNYDVDVDQTATRQFGFVIPAEAAPGIYDIRYVVSNGKIKKINHRSFEVI